MPRKSQALGRAGEALAAAHLERLGYAILARNVRVGHGELDLVARQGEELVIVEVRLRRASTNGSAVASLNPRKLRRLRATVLGYMVELYGDHPPPWRVDVVAIDLDRAGRVTSLAVLPSAVEEDT